MTEAKIGHGSQFWIATPDSPSDYLLIAEVTNIKPPKLARDAIDASSNMSPDGWREYIPGLKDGGEVQFDLNFVPGGASTSRILGLFSKNKSNNCKISFPDSPATDWIFSGLITGFDPDDPFDEKMTASVTFKVSGKPSFIS